MRILGLDVGDKYIGSAVSDGMGWTAQGVSTITRRNQKDDFCEIRKIMDEYEVEEIVVGLPKNMNGSIGSQGEKAIAFADALRGEMGDIAVHLYDERLTTCAAERILIESDMSRKKRKKVIDKLAAVMILQSYLDSRGKPV